MKEINQTPTLTAEKPSYKASPYKLSLICPIYKVKPYLEPFLDSLLMGVNHSSVEVFLIDDACPEQSFEICEKYLKSHKDRIFFKYHLLKLPENKGIGGARNAGLRRATGDYIGFVDSDDLISKYFWSTLQNRILKAESDIIEYEYDEFTQDTDSTIVTMEPNTTYTQPESIDPNTSTTNFDPKITPFYNGFFCWRRLFKRELIGDLLFEEKIEYEDISFVMQLFSRCNTIEYHKAILIHYRKRSGSITTAKSRNSNFAMQLSSLRKGLILSLPYHNDHINILNKVVNKSLIILLKGCKIKSREQRYLFFSMCSNEQKTLSATYKKYKNQASLISNILFSTKLYCLKTIIVLGQYS